jgi:hypothetical protein
MRSSGSDDAKAAGRSRSSRDAHRFVAVADRRERY